MYWGKRNEQIEKKEKKKKKFTPNETQETKIRRKWDENIAEEEAAMEQE